MIPNTVVEHDAHMAHDGQQETDTGELIVRQDAQPTARITLNRPEKRNALSVKLMQDITEALKRLGADRLVHTIVIEGAGTAFSAGHDLTEMGGRDLAFYRHHAAVTTEMMETIHRVPQPVIAKVHGTAAAAACQLAASCDLIVADEGARFSTPGVNIGLFCSTPGVAVVRAIGRKRAMEMLLTGKFIDASTALQWGLVNQVVASDHLEDAVQELADSIGQFSSLTVGIGKQTFYAQVDLDEHRAYDLMEAVIAMNSMAADAQEGICAFVDKRKPEWTGS